MKLDGRVVVVTRGVSELGLALASGCQKEGAAVVLCDKNERSLLRLAKETGATAIAGNSTHPADIKTLIDRTMHRFGRIDLFVSNEPVGTLGAGFSNDREWNSSLQPGLLSQMHAVKYMLPQWLNRKHGYFLVAVPETGLFTEYNLGNYSTLKHPSLSFAERMSDLYGNLGLKVSVFCFESPATTGDEVMIEGAEYPDKVLDMADQIIEGIQEQKFMIRFQRKSKPISGQHPSYQRHITYSHIRA